MIIILLCGITVGFLWGMIVGIAFAESDAKADDTTVRPMR